MKPNEYWNEAIECAFDGAGVFSAWTSLTEEQRAAIAASLTVSHEHYGMAFYSPPSTDGLHQIERDHAARLKALEQRMESERRTAHAALKRALHQSADALISVDEDGRVYRHDGRTTQIA